jgi:gamma-glutamyltranspeptidase/glutathione hydrolase
MVVSVSEAASETGIRILKQGGNAVDAAVAVALVLEVTWPEAGNIGGGGFMMVQPAPGKKAVCIEYRETAPAAATAEMFTATKSRLGCMVVGVPGTLRGLELASQKFGRLPWHDLVEPAQRLADQGFAVDAALAASLNKGLARDGTSTPEFQRVYGKADGTLWHAGDFLKQPDLARTLDIIAHEGADAFYNGSIARLITDEMQRGGGIVTSADLAAYEARLREPVEISFRGHTIFAPPLPSSGGICLSEMLHVLSEFDLRQRGRWSADTVQLMSETMKRAYCDRARYLGDADFVQIPDRLTSVEYARQQAATIDVQQATPSRDLAPELPIADESPSTTHFSVIDSSGMAVSNTYTLEQSFGSKVVVRGAGFLLNNEMGDFNWIPGRTDTSGRIGTPANVVAPGKRMLSSQTPVIVTREGEAVLVTGSPGGRTIINTVLCVLLNVLEFEMDLPAAIQESRLHHGWLPDQLRLEDGDDARFGALVTELRSRGQHVVIAGRQGDAHSIQRDPATHQLQGVADGRRHGHARGY